MMRKKYTKSRTGCGEKRAVRVTRVFMNKSVKCACETNMFFFFQGVNYLGTEHGLT